MGKLIGVLAVAMLASLHATAAQSTGERLAVPGGELAYDVAGPSTAPAVVFLHGAFMDRGSWDRQFKVFAEKFRVVRYDIRPFGQSTIPEKAYSVPDDLLRLLDHLRIDRAHLVGHSFGGASAIDFALVHPKRVASLVLVGAAPNGYVAPEDERKAAMAIFAAVKNGDDAILKAWIDHPMWAVSRTMPNLVRELEAITRRNLAPFRMAFAPYVPVTPPAVDRLKEITAPTLVIIGGHDTPGNIAGAKLVATQVPGATMHVLTEADHGLPLGWSVDFNSRVLEFIANTRR